MTQKTILLAGNNTATDQAIADQLVGLNHSVLSHFDTIDISPQSSFSTLDPELNHPGTTLQLDIQRTLTQLKAQNEPLNALIITLETYTSTFTATDTESNTQDSTNNQTPDNTVNDFINIENLDSATISHMLVYNTALSIEICQMAKPLLKQNGGNIVIMGSLNGSKTVPSAVHFAASKAALLGLNQALARELGRYNICVNLVIPGITEDTHNGYVPQQHVDNFLKHSALRRLARPSEIADIICWFALENTYVTAQSIIVDGGL